MVCYLPSLLVFVSSAPTVEAGALRLAWLIHVDANALLLTACSENAPSRIQKPEQTSFQVIV